MKFAGLMQTWPETYATRSFAQTGLRELLSDILVAEMRCRPFQIDVQPSPETTCLSTFRYDLLGLAGQTSLQTILKVPLG